MSELSMMVTITERSKLTTFLSFYRERQVPVQFISLALGTASNETLNYLGLARSDRNGRSCAAACGASCRSTCPAWASPLRSRSAPSAGGASCNS